ncbi:cytochrome c biogenesis protein CcmG, thiol:disulfide interchange protein DsbE [Thalassovita litoralis]|jgi:cytochrome c biogenesis protein CcmG/thiol:disulfide interchange protein DsbE|uniref:Cytochrome c biogenesis protein CcmG, thiol:disulfide interchange protein DsbE n=1 Tax=Thalassovita litoralis TaxID=1010611 RepID=A0A521DYC1_9RHOB|nr:DsbE family thiol:disulfide interchange protein [Thalassovita litoralis]SMO76713.1 cytochrome c biogenesis protein CcmG, thiol:disulfide interchange protein DsbE [Thalassovita litoralis]
MAKISPMMIAPPVIFAGLAAMFLIGMQRENPNELPTTMAGKSAPAVQVVPLSDLPGFTDETLRDGQVKLVNFWASWCAPCRVEHPNLEALAEQGVTIYGVNYKDKPEAALKFLAELGNPYAGIGQDDTGRMGLNWGVYGVPETYLIDGEGRIVTRHAGPITQRVIETTLGPAIKKAMGQ